MSKEESCATAIVQRKEQLDEDLKRQANLEKHRIKLETLRDCIRTNGVGPSDTVAERINSLFDTIKL